MSLEELVQFMSVRSIHISLVKEWELGFVALAGECINLSVGAWLLTSKLVAWEANHAESLAN